MYLEKVSEDSIDFLDPLVFGALTIMRGVFVTVDTEDPALMDFRVQKLKAMMQEYINNPSGIVSYFLENYRTTI